MQMGALNDYYIVERDGQRRYIYDATWRRKDKAVVWEARVYLDQKLCGTPSGLLSDVSRGAEIARVRQMVETSIEHIDGINKV
jgi:hypothetical protein